MPISKSVGADGSLKVFGWGSIAVDGSGALVVDHHRDVIEPVELENAAYEFTKASRQLDVMHDRHPVGDLIESAYLSPEKLKAMGLSGDERHGWWAGFEIRDPETIAAVKSGSLPEMSVDITASRHIFEADQTAERITKSAASHPNDPNRPIGRLRDLKISLLSLVDAGAGKGVRVALWKRAQPVPSKETIKMDIKKKAALLALLKAMAPTAPAPDDVMLSQIMAKLTPEEQAALTAMLVEDEPDPAMDPAVPGADTPAAKALQKRLEDQETGAKKNRDELQKLRDQVEDDTAISKAKADGFVEYLAGLSNAEVEAVIKGLRRTKARGDAESATWVGLVEKALKAGAKAVKDSLVLKKFGGIPSTDQNGLTFEELYEAEKSKRPDADPAALQRELGKKHPALFKARTRAQRES